MRQRDIIVSRIEMLEARFKILEFMVRRGSPLSEYFQTLEESTEILNDITYRGSRFTSTTVRR
jgi:hypothetical protein